MGSLSLLRNDLVGPSCDLLKVIPGERLLDSSVLHYYHSTDHLLLRTSHPLYGTHEHIVTGKESTSLASIHRYHIPLPSHHSCNIRSLHTLCLHSIDVELSI
jgi:hypothetical protein